MLVKKRQRFEFGETLHTNDKTLDCDLCFSRFPDEAEVQIGADKDGWVLILCDHCWDLTQTPTPDGFSTWRENCYLEKGDRWGGLGPVCIEDLQ